MGRGRNDYCPRQDRRGPCNKDSGAIHRHTGASTFNQGSLRRTGQKGGPWKPTGLQETVSIDTAEWRGGPHFRRLQFESRMVPVLSRQSKKILFLAK